MGLLPTTEQKVDNFSGVVGLVVSVFLLMAHVSDIKAKNSLNGFSSQKCIVFFP